MFLFVVTSCDSTARQSLSQAEQAPENTFSGAVLSREVTMKTYMFMEFHCTVLPKPKTSPLLGARDNMFLFSSLCLSSNLFLFCSLTLFSPRVLNKYSSRDLL